MLVCIPHAFAATLLSSHFDGEAELLGSALGRVCQPSA